MSDPIYKMSDRNYQMVKGDLEHLQRSFDKVKKLAEDRDVSALDIATALSEFQGHLDHSRFCLGQIFGAEHLLYMSRKQESPT